MLYRTNPKNGERLSQLGFGCMRFPKDDGEVEAMIACAVESGVNYFDTAYVYPHSEERLGKVMAKGYRDRVRIATKLPLFLARKREDFDRLFDTQRRRLQTDSIDYYLMHMLPGVTAWERFLGLGILDWFAKKRSVGQLAHIGFSYHGGLLEFKKLVDVHDWDFCMLQFNYLDERSQAGIEGVEYAASKGLPVIAMEPLRGGMLASKLPGEALEVWKNAPEARSPAEWGIRWVLNHPAVMMALSGMSSLEMVKENVRIACGAEANTLREAELARYEQIRRILMGKGAIPCTGCNYCVPCPQGVDIPMCFSCYNDTKMGATKGIKKKFHYASRTSGHQASLCVQCGACEKHCPQNIGIRQALKGVEKEMEGVLYKPVAFVCRKFLHL
ncbi:MAG: aldo/keto reductase [Firmicutes bacterium]|nr:aldo/keto reductase [Bacillota bacterium]